MIKWIQPPLTFYIYSIAWLVLHEGKDFYCWSSFLKGQCKHLYIWQKTVWNCLKYWYPQMSSSKSISKLGFFSYKLYLFSTYIFITIYWHAKMSTLLKYNIILAFSSGSQFRSSIYKLSIYDFFKYTLALCKYWSRVKAMRNIHGNIPQTLWTTS